MDRILVQRVRAEAKTAGGIFLPESSVKELNEAKVLAVGPGGLDRDGKRITPSVGPGDKVLIPQVWHRPPSPYAITRSPNTLTYCPWWDEQYGGSPVKVGDEEYHLFRDHE